VGYGVSIPETDINANFYYMARDKYNSNIMDNSNSIPNMQDYANRVGKGYIPTEQKSAKYSVVAYLNLKNNPVLTHIKTNTKIDGQIIQNAIANCYILKIGEKCLKYKENELILGSCDDEDETQFFSIIFNGIVKNQCVLKHVNTGRIIKYKAGLFTLDDENTGIDRDYTLFTME